MKDMLLYVGSYPDATPVEAIDQAVRFAAATGGGLTALAVQVNLQATSNYLASRLINLAGVCAEQEAKSLAASREALRAVDERLVMHGVKGGGVLTRADLYSVGEHVAFQARTRDVCLVPLSDELNGQRAIAEAVVFGSARPVLLYRPGVADLPSRSLGTVVVAWDGSRTAARALAAAMPLLSKARHVRVLTVVNEKTEASPGLGGEVMRHLGVYGVDAAADEVDGGSRKIGQVLSDHAAQHRADLLVMGAYGRTRVRDFILGGATETMLRDPRTPILLAH